MKKLSILLAAFAAATLFAAEDSVYQIDNTKWVPGKAGAPNTVAVKDGVVTYVAGDKSKESGGVFQHIVLNQEKPAPIIFGAESKLEGAPEGVAESIDYSVYLDVKFSDNTWQYAVHVKFPASNHDWIKRTGGFTPKKPIKELNYYLLFRKRDAGTAQFRNAFLLPANK